MRSTRTAYGTGSSMRVPPSLAYSATTPALRRLTSSIKAGGHDHSRPTITPIFDIVYPPIAAAGRAGLARFARLEQVARIAHHDSFGPAQAPFDCQQCFQVGIQ